MREWCGFLQIRVPTHNTIESKIKNAFADFYLTKKKPAFCPLLKIVVATQRRKEVYM